MPKHLLILLLILPLSCFAQFTITGKVLSSSTHKPIGQADVFINNSTAGTASGSNGQFNLYRVYNGKYTLIISEIGYIDQVRHIDVNSANVNIGDIFLTPSNKTLKEVVIKPKNSIPDYFYDFVDQFLGKTTVAHDCRILNPEILTIDFNRVDSVYTASSDGYLIIENPDLGYRIKYKLLDFYYRAKIDSQSLRYHGYVHFDPMVGRPSEMRRWERYRYNAYKNSAMHFYRALVSDRIDDEGFKVQQYAIFQNPDRLPDSIIYKYIAHFKELEKRKNERHAHDSLRYWQEELKQPKIFSELRPYRLEQKDILQRTEQRDLLALGCDRDGLFVSYSEDKHFDHDDNSLKFQHLRNPRNTECTEIKFNANFAFIDRYGLLLDPYDISYVGVWANMRTADLLPEDYIPDEQTVAPSVPVDSTVSKNIMARLADYNSRYIKEKAYLHFDRPYYAAGDTMFFKAYVTLGNDNLPSNLSKVLHVDLIDNKQQINKSIVLGIDSGIAWGDLVLPDSLAGGNYQVRAYTEWMRNTGQQNFFNKLVPVAAVTGVKNDVIHRNPAQHKSAKPDMQFFPEGGNWVAGLKCKIAFKAVDPGGFGIDVKGTVVDDSGTKVGAFASAHKGMGYFYLTAEAGKKYKANLIYANGAQDVISLPAFTGQGIAMAVNNDSIPEISVKVMSDQKYFNANKGRDYTLIVYSGGKATSFIFKLDSTEVNVDIYKRELRTGIARITLFAPGGEPLCERLAFVQNADGLKLKINTGKDTYKTRDTVAAKLNVLDGDNAPVAGHFSVSVTDENKLPVNELYEHTILTDMLLTSQLSGYVEQPNYYFHEQNPEVLGELDILMLTQGYRNFSWKQVLDTEKTTVKFPAETSLSISGTLKTLTGKPVKNGTVTLLSTKHRLAKDTTTDENGNFKITGLYLTDTAKLVLHGHTKSNNDKVNIEVNNKAPATIKPDDPDTALNMIQQEIAAGMKKRYEQSGSLKTGILLKQVNIKVDKHPSWAPHVEHSANLNGPGIANSVIMGDKLLGCARIDLCLEQLIPAGEVQWVDSAGMQLARSTRTPLQLHGRTPIMGAVIDGMVTDQSEIYNLNAEDIYSIEILKSQSYLTVYGSQGVGGLIVITTKNGSEMTKVNADGSIVYTFHGFEKARNFYSPKYNISLPANNHPDQRTTIYWQPDLVTDNSGNAGFNFFNAADPGKYRVVIEGMDASGNIGRKVLHYTVK